MSLEDKVNELIRHGIVVKRDEQNMRVCVNFSDTVTKPLTTNWLPVLLPRANGDCYYDLPDIGDKVLCLFLPNGIDTGFVLGSFYGENKSPITNGDIYFHKFKDGTYLEYNRKEHKLIASCVGDVELSAQKNISITAQNVNIVAQDTVSILGKKVTIQG